MSRYLPEPAWRHGTPARTAVVLINLGTPEAPTAAALRTYLREFLSDPRVVEIPRPIWWPILNGVILNTRPAKSAEKYATVWTPEGSPLKVHTERQTRLLKDRLDEAGHRGLVVDYAMRYGRPSIPATLARLKAEGCARFLLVPLYPQYAGSTSATALDEAYRWLAATRNQPELRVLRSFCDDPGYIAALAAGVRAHWAEHGRPERGYRLLMSFHGVPRFTLDRGDPYHCECLKTGRLLAEALALSPDEHVVCFQSRFGRAEWLQPYTAPTLQALAREGVGRVDVICPGFVGDCLETLEEIAMEGKEDFLAAGGKEYHYIPALNERDEWIAALAALVEAQLGGWPTREAPDDAALALSTARAGELGAAA
ncbi:MAG: ferrochelatase [Rhodocyclaceae bacterium]|nr:ferrochelatase [Rhodocyclaceae bacterium]